MAIKAVTRRQTKPAAKTLSEMLAAAFTASTRYPGIFRPEGFSTDYSGIDYDPFENLDDDLPKGYCQDSDTFQPPFDAAPSEHCCGLLGIGNFDSTPLSSDPQVSAALMEVFMAAIAEKYTMVMATVIPSQEIARAQLEACGFVPVADFHSKTTKAYITVLMNDFTGRKFLPEGDLCLSTLDFSDR